MSLWNDSDTICAVSTPAGVGGISVIRISGPQALNFARRICGFLPQRPESHRVYFGTAKEIESGNSIDEVLASFFSSGHSYTGDETVEISCHGSPVICESLLEELIDSGCRLARPGEFTSRAFLNGNLDLVQAESVLDVIESRSKIAARAAIRQLKGSLSNKIKRVEDELLLIAAHLEASIDFSAENLETLEYGLIQTKCKQIIIDLECLLSSHKTGCVLRDGIECILFGEPNVGKSSLLNALLEEDRAIVTEVPGTTRDLIEATLVGGQVPLRLIDSAGVRETSDTVEQAGISRTRDAARQADFVLYLVEAETKDWAANFGRIGGEKFESCYIVVTKTDLVCELPGASDIRQAFSAATGFAPEPIVFYISSKTGAGLNELRSELQRRAMPGHGDLGTVIMRARHFELLETARGRVMEALSLVRSECSPELITLEITEGLKAIEEVLGKSFDEQVIDRIFSEFCLGK